MPGTMIILISKAVMPRPILLRRKNIDDISTKVLCSHFFQRIPVSLTYRLLFTSFHVFSLLAAFCLIFAHLLGRDTGTRPAFYSSQALPMEILSGRYLIFLLPIIFQVDD